MELLLTILVVVLVIAVVVWLVDWVRLPNPINWVVKLIVAVLSIAFLLKKVGII